MWPISPAASLAPWIISPLTTRPPPIPVPSVMPDQADGRPSRRPIHHSPNVAQLASLSSVAVKPSRSETRSRSGKLRQPRLGVWITTPVSRSSGPGAPMPTPAICSRVAPRSRSSCATTWPTISTTRVTTASEPRSASVGSVCTATASPPSSGTAPTTMLVPPMSTPMIQRPPGSATRHSPSERTARNASCGISTLPDLLHPLLALLLLLEELALARDVAAVALRGDVLAQRPSSSRAR